VDEIRSVAVLGASGTVGSLVGGLIAQEGIKVYFLSRSEERSQRGMARAIGQARSEVIGKNIICGNYDSRLAEALAEADWIVEAVAEDAGIKRGLYEKVEKLKGDEAIVSSTTSSLPLEELVEGRSEGFRRRFLSTHFYNPPGRMLACEVTGTEDTAPEVVEFMSDFLAERLGREVVRVKNTTGFAGNRIAFVLFGRITALAEEHGVELMDYLIGPYTGRVMAPLATLDLVGLDIHKAIIDSLHRHTDDYLHDWLMLPEYLNRMIGNGLLGNKAGGGFYRRHQSGRYMFIEPSSGDYTEAIGPHIRFVEKAKHFIHMGMYRDAFEVIREARGKEAQIVREILCTYAAYAYSLIGEVTEEAEGIGGIDRVMSFGFHWAPPSVILEMLGGKDSFVELAERSGIKVPDAIGPRAMDSLELLEAGRYFVAK